MLQITQADLENVQMQLVLDELPDEMQDNRGEQHNPSDQAPDDTDQQSQQSINQQNPSPPDAQYANPSDPAGREDT